MAAWRFGMRQPDKVCLPPPHVLEALRQPRQPQLHDEQVKDMLRRWRCLGRPITQDEFSQLLDLLVPRLEQRYRIMRIRAAVLAAGIEISDRPQLVLFNPTFTDPVPPMSEAEHADLRRPTSAGGWGEWPTAEEWENHEDRNAPWVRKSDA
jgi:hypothetical protein